jgi:hypothetical protein
MFGFPVKKLIVSCTIDFHQREAARILGLLQAGKL